jgi:hypothetical protein
MVPKEFPMRPSHRQFPDRSFIERAIADTKWDTGNDVLYKLCEDHPEHTADAAILAKVWLIGRAYAAAVERRTENREVTNDVFWKHVVSKMKRIDPWLADVRRSPHDQAVILRVHRRLTDLFESLTGLEKRSLASKYLHFHFRDSFFIYDSRAKGVVGQLHHERVGLDGLAEHDPEYATFFRKCTALTQRFSEQIEKPLSPRDLDKVLLAWHRGHSA